MGKSILSSMSCLSAPKQNDYQAAPRMKAKNNTGDWLADARARLLSVSQQPALEAQVLLAHVIDKPRAWVIAHSEANLSSDQASSLCVLLERRLSGEPLPYLVGHWDFFGFSFKVTTDVLIPRPETELLVEKALTWLRAHPSRRLAVDVGTGSGCIAVSLVRLIKNLQVVALDVSWNALQVTRQNVFDHQVQDRVLLVQSNLMAGLQAKVDLVCANLPYIPTSTLAELEVGRREPSQALDGGPDGMSYIRALLEDGPRRLAPGALLLLEIGDGQGETVPKIARQFFPAAEIQLFHDLAGNPRLVQVETKIK
jgi:release factor glutamine methyltransferase